MGEAQVLGADAGARVRGEWRRHLGCRAWACGSLEAATCGTGSGASEMLCGARVGLRKSVLNRENG